jgi:hypothetical protein
MEIKIECFCGQHYKFDVEPENGQMPVEVACPGCGADGTEAANHFIRQALSLQAPVPVPTPPSRAALRIGSPAPGGTAPAVEEPPVQIVPAPAPTASGRAATVAAPVAPRKKGSFSLGLLGGVMGTALGVAVWLAIFYATDLGSRGILKLFAIAVGFSAGLGARLLSRDEGSKDLGYITAAIAFVGIFAAQYLIAYEQTVGEFKDIVGTVFDEQVAYAKRAVQAIPAGSDREIRDFLTKEKEASLKEMARDADSKEHTELKLAPVTPEEVTDFKEERLPRLRELASGKITKESLHKEIGTDKIEENEGFKLFLAFRGLGAFGIGAMVIALGAAFKMSATDA